MSGQNTNDALTYFEVVLPVCEVLLDDSIGEDERVVAESQAPAMVRAAMNIRSHRRTKVRVPRDRTPAAQHAPSPGAAT